MKKPISSKFDLFDLILIFVFNIEEGDCGLYFDMEFKGLLFVGSDLVLHKTVTSQLFDSPICSSPPIKLQTL